jgi:PKD repeat protein
MSADFNLWSPTVEQSSEFSLSQLWVARGQTTDNSLQTAETGWQNFQQLYGDSRSHLFIYHTTGNYQTGTGCYNLTCTGFVQTDNSVILGGSFTSYSTVGGAQYDISLAYFRDLSAPYNWWLKFNGTWVGYYPNSLFDSQGIANYSDRTDFGGEIVNNQTGGLHTTTQMGSGRFPSEGLGAAAYTNRIQYWDTSGTQLDATSLTPDVTNASYYDLSLGSSTDSSVGSYFYFGGPGRVASSAPAANFTYSANPKAGQPVQFTDTSTGSPTSWSWNFGDGGAATTQNPTHTFGTGTYQVSLTVSNSGSSNTNTQGLVVSPGSGIGCTADTYTMCLVNSRYKVTSHWKNQYAGGAVANLSKAKLTDTTGAFWIADANTYEYLIRFNTATNNGRTWIAIPTFTDVEFWVDVTDTVGGQSKEYHSAPGNETLIYDPYFFVYP